MKNFLVVFLILVMFTPALACAMPVCPESKAAGYEDVKQRAEPPPCAGHAVSHDFQLDEAGGDAEALTGVMLLKDCMGVDLQLSDKAPDIKKPGINKDISFSLTAALAPDMVFEPGAAGPIRAPPERYARAQFQPPLLLTTGRFRI